MIRFLDNLQPWGALLLRLVLGLSIVVHGYQKVSTHTALDHFVQTVVSLGLPYWLAYVSAATEFIGGILVVLGLFTRFVSALIAINMLVALFTVGIHQVSASTTTLQIWPPSPSCSSSTAQAPSPSTERSAFPRTGPKLTSSTINLRHHAISTEATQLHRVAEWRDPCISFCSCRCLFSIPAQISFSGEFLGH